MSDHNRPWFKLYPRDLLTDEKVQAFDLEQLGAYIKLLCVMWKASDVRIPNDKKALMNILGVTHKKFSRIWKTLMPGNYKKQIFKIEKDEYGDEWLYSKRLEIELNEVLELSQIRREVGMKGGRPKKQLHNQLQSNCITKTKAKRKQTITDTDTDTEKRIDLSKDKSGLLPSEAADADVIPFSIPSKKTSGHFSSKVGGHFKTIKASCDAIQKLPQKNGHRFNPYQWVQKHVNEKRHPGAIAETIKALSDPGIFSGIREGPFKYANSILATKNQNWNEKEAIDIHDEFKRMTIPELQRLTAGIMKEMG